MNSRTETQHEEKNERGDGTPYVTELDDELHISVISEDFTELIDIATEFTYNFRLRIHEETLELHQFDPNKACIVQATIPIDRTGPEGAYDIVIQESDLESYRNDWFRYCDTLITVKENGVLTLKNGFQYETEDITEINDYYDDSLQALGPDRMLPDARWPPESEPSDYTTTVEMDVERFVGAFRGISAAADATVRLTANDDELVFGARGYDDDDPIEYPYEWSFPADITGSPAQAVYSSFLTAPIAKHLSKYEDLSIRFGDHYPIELQQESRRFILAPTGLDDPKDGDSR